MMELSKNTAYKHTFNGFKFYWLGTVFIMLQDTDELTLNGSELKPYGKLLTELDVNSIAYIRVLASEDKLEVVSTDEFMAALDRVMEIAKENISNATK